MQRTIILLTAILALLAAPTRAEEAYETWPLLRENFPSTGGGGIIIGEYRPLIIGERCVTPFTATEPNGTVHRNIVVFEIIATQGGILCTNGQWRSIDGIAAGTTPFRVFIKNGISRVPP